MKKMGAKAVVVALAGVLAIGGAVGGTIAWLTDEAGPVTNTFSVGDIKITLTESVDSDFKIIPGGKEAKDPVVTVSADSESCYLFVEVIENNNAVTGTTNLKYVTYNFDQKGWTPLTEVTGRTIYWRTVASTEDTKSFYLLQGEGDGVFKNGVVSYSSDLTKEQLTAVGGNKPSLTFTAYAIQSENLPTYDGKSPQLVAWELVSKSA